MGKPKYIPTPENLWELFEKYVGQLEILKQQVPHVKFGTVDIEIKEPMTMEGFKCFGHENGITINHYIANSEDAYTEYRTTITRIKDTIFKHNFSRAAAGIYKENLIARQLALGDKSQVDSTVEVKGLPINIITNSPPLSNDEK